MGDSLQFCFWRENTHNNLAGWINCAFEFIYRSLCDVPLTEGKMK
jgi:hypothetical protein